MRILIDLGHPAHIHLFRHAIEEWKEREHEVILVVRDKDIVTDLMDVIGWEYTIGSRARTGRFGLFLELIEHDWRVLSVARKHRVSVMLGTSVSIAHASKLTSARSVVFNEDDSDVARVFAKLAYPFADAIVTPRGVRVSYRRKHVMHDSYHELAYLHPERFAPDPHIRAELGLDADEPFFILRFVSFDAAHDWGEGGIATELRKELVQALSARGRVFVSAEGEAPDWVHPYLFPLSHLKMHDALHGAMMFVGESQTMAVEAAVLGTPSIRCNTFVGRCSVLEELEHTYGLTYGFRPENFEAMMGKIEGILDDEETPRAWELRRQTLLSEKTDLTAWMVDWVEQLG